MINNENEQALISNLIRYGFEAYYEISTLGITSDSFSGEEHKMIYDSLHNLFENKDTKKVDLPLIIGSAHDRGYGWWAEQNRPYIENLANQKFSIENTKTFGQKIRKLQIANQINKAAEDIQTEIASITGEEKLSEIFSIVENKLGHLANFLTDTSEEPVNIGSSIQDHIKRLSEDRVDQLGLPTGFPIFDKCIGGGLRRHAITVIAARMKCGKSTMCKNMAYNIAALDIPVLYLDTEMESDDQKNRLLASVGDVEIDNVETGKFVDNPIDRQKIQDAANRIASVKFHHKNIAGMSIEMQLAIIRKWIISEVGLNKDGKAKECLLVYDYIKLMDSKDLGKAQEHQLLGFLMTTLQGIAVKYDIPILTAAQLNRDGISKEDTSVIGGSDRIAQYGSAIAVLKWKSPEELAAENYEWGNQKLIPLVSRYGSQPEGGDYINIIFEGSKSKMSEKGVRANSQNLTTNKKTFKKKDATNTNKDTAVENPNDLVPF